MTDLAKQITKQWEQLENDYTEKERLEAADDLATFFMSVGIELHLTSDNGETEIPEPDEDDREEERYV